MDERKELKTAILFSGGKDSCMALQHALQSTNVQCLITMISENPASYMFHTPNIHLDEMQAKALDIPLMISKTKGEKEKELADLKDALAKAIKKYDIDGIYTGAVCSVYQAERIQKICDELKIRCFNPLWQMNQIELLHELLKNNFKVMISGVFAYPLDEKWLGKIIDKETISKLEELQKKFKLNPAGEGGELESTVLDCPIFKKRIEIIDSKIEYKNHAGNFIVKKARLVEK